MEAPPSYDTAVSSAASKQSTSDSVRHKSRNGIPPQSRRSMEDESRPLPDGWIRQFDAPSGHQFFVDTTASPPRSTWHHPNDDEEYLSTLPPNQRDHIHSLLRVPTQADMMAESSGDDDDHHDHSHGNGGSAAAGSSQQQSHFPTELPRRPSPPPKGFHKLGRNLKDKLTSSTHSEREIARAQRAEEERKTYARHKMYREAMARAIETGEPQLLGKDRQGKDVYIEPPVGYGTGGYGAYGGGYGYNPYSQGPYTSPNARFMRPQTDYYRPFGYGYGGGLGLPLGLGVGAGLLGGALLF